jgi:CO/xanthine dehydrogenase Mo-binding subunit
VDLGTGVRTAITQIVADELDVPLARINVMPWGVGEPSSAIVSAAISNAVFDAIGVRLRSVPFTPQKTLAAMKS